MFFCSSSCSNVKAQSIFGLYSAAVLLVLLLEIQKAASSPLARTEQDEQKLKITLLYKRDSFFSVSGTREKQKLRDDTLYYNRQAASSLKLCMEQKIQFYCLLTKLYFPSPLHYHAVKMILRRISFTLAKLKHNTTI